MKTLIFLSAMISTGHVLAAEELAFDKFGPRVTSMQPGGEITIEDDEEETDGIRLEADCGRRLFVEQKRFPL